MESDSNFELDRYNARNERAGAHNGLPDGCLARIVGPVESGARIIEVWQSGEHAKRFSEQSTPLIAGLEIPPPAIGKVLSTKTSRGARRSVPVPVAPDESPCMAVLYPNRAAAARARVAGDNVRGRRRGAPARWLALELTWRMAASRFEGVAGSSSREMPEELNSRHLVRRLVALLVLIALVAAAVGSLPGLGTLRHRFAQADLAFVGLIGLLKLGSCLSNVVAFREVFCPRMTWRFSSQLALAEQATNVLVPTGGAGGLALGAWALRQGGMSTEHIGRRSVAFFVLTSIPNFAFAAVLGPLLLTGLFSGHVPFVPTLVLSAGAWTVAAVVALLPRLLGRIDPAKPGGAVAGRLRSAAVTLENGIRDTGQLLRSGDWKAIVGAIGYLVFDIAALIAAFAAFGGGLPLAPLIFAYVIGQLGGLLPLPAGVGGTDGGLIGAMVLYGSSLSQAAAAVLAYRLFQLGVPSVLGAIAFIRLRRTLSQSPAPAAACAPLAEPLAIKVVRNTA